MLTPYKPSGRCSVLFFLMVPVFLVVGVGAAWIYQLLIDWIPFIYISVLITLGFGGVLAAGVYALVRRGKCRNSMLATGAALLVALASWGAGFHFAHERVKATALAEASNAAQREAVAGFTLQDYLALRVENGWSIGRVARRGGSLSISGFFVYVVWLIEAGIVLGVPLLVSVRASREPFSEAVDDWADQPLVEAVVLRPTRITIEELRRSQSLDALLGIPLNSEGPADEALTYALRGHPSEKRDAYLTVTHKIVTTNAKGKTENKVNKLFRNVIVDFEGVRAFVEFAERVKRAQEAGSSPAEPGPGESPPEPDESAHGSG